MVAATHIPAKTSAVFDLLKKHAGEMQTITYGEIAHDVGLANEEVGQPLSYIRDHICRHRGLPWLDALAVNRHTMRPSQGFLLGLELGGDEERFWRGMVLQVFAYDWSGVVLDE
jgi:hypothetical protein